jgi:hypothetical protein
MDSECLPVLEKKWRSVSRVIFKQDIGPLSDYIPWLTRFNLPMKYRKSSVCGSEIAYAISEYSENSKWVGLEEIDFNKKFEPLSLNEIKDIDSLLSSLSDRFYYAGNIILGNSGQVERSSNISDSYFMHQTGLYNDCKYMAYSTHGRLNEECFGGNAIGESAHCINCFETFRDKRCLELWMAQNCSDCYYSHNLDTCQDCMFCFNVKNRRHAIGNLELPPEKYAQIREKLLSEMAHMLKKKKKLPALVDIAAKCSGMKPEITLQTQKPEPTDKRPMETAFAKTYSLLFGKPPSGDMDAYSEWLMRHTRKIEYIPSAFSKKKVVRYDYASYFEIPKERLLKREEAIALGEQAKIGEGEATSLTLSNSHEKISPIAFFTSEYQEGTHSNLIDVATSSSSTNCYRSSPAVYSKYCGYTFWPRSTEHAFGCTSLLDSEFCINCYWSVKLRRCFEMDSCRTCSDCLYCHNCENLTDCMFCFNTKNKRYSIGNVEVGREKFLEMKQLALSAISRSLDSKHDLALDIYNLGRSKK